MPNPQPTAGRAEFSSYQKFIIALLAFLQFTIVLDFMILSPLGALLLQALKLPASRFGLVVSVYAFSAGASGLVASGLADRFDLKRLLLFFYTGFVVGTALCAVATSYEFLLAARTITPISGLAASSTGCGVGTSGSNPFNPARVIPSFAPCNPLGFTNCV